LAILFCISTGKKRTNKRNAVTPAGRFEPRMTAPNKYGDVLTHRVKLAKVAFVLHFCETRRNLSGL
jgi:hypothetical protein